MLKGFEEQTHNLTDYELREILPIVVRGFKKKTGKENSITNPEICKALTEYYGLDKISEPRVRKIIYYIRQKNLVPRLIATSKGYWVATSKQELEDWRETILGRINAMQETLNYAVVQIEEWDKPEKQKQQSLF
jgi:hypothetical protein